MVCERQAQVAAPLPPTLTAGFSSHSLRRGSAAYANASSQLAIQWISTRGAWLLDLLTKAFAYVGTTTREDQSVGKVLAGYRDPYLSCATPTIATLSELLHALEYAQLLTVRGQLFKNVSGFTDTTLNVDALVLDAALASLLIHLDEVATAVQQEQAATGFTSHYLYRFHEALDATNTALGARLSLDTCIGWGRQLRTAWETENFGQLGERSNGNTTVLAAAVTQMLSSIATMQRTLQKLVAVQERKSASADGPAPCRCAGKVPQASTYAVLEAHSLAGCFFNWYTLELWHTATQKKQQFVRADLKAAVNIMVIAARREVDLPTAPLDRDGVAYRLWKQRVWTLAEDFDKKANAALESIDGKGRSKTAGSLRKRWRKLRVDHRFAYDTLCSAFITRKANGGIVDRCTPASHQWKQKDLES